MLYDIIFKENYTNLETKIDQNSWLYTNLNYNDYNNDSDSANFTE